MVVWIKTQPLIHTQTGERRGGEDKSRGEEKRGGDTHYNIHHCYFLNPMRQEKLIGRRLPT
jgi:hypothetical protein